MEYREDYRFVVFFLTARPGQPDATMAASIRDVRPVPIPWKGPVTGNSSGSELQNA